MLPSYIKISNFLKNGKIGHRCLSTQTSVTCYESHGAGTPSPLITSYSTKSLRKKMQLIILASLYTISCLGTNIICSVVKKANSSIGFLRRNLQIRQKDIKANAYKTLVRPQIEYASTIWDPFTQEN